MHGHNVALLINGTVGAGKTSVSDAAGDILSGTGVPNAVIDLDELRRSWPSPPGDRFNVQVTLRNLSDVSRNYLDAGARRLIMAGVVESQADRDRYRDAVGVPLAVCHLAVDLPTIHARLALRHKTDPQARNWHLDRSGELDDILFSAKVSDFTVNVGQMSVHEVARAVLEAAGWA